MSRIDDLRKRFRLSPLYELWRLYRERQQLKAFNAVLESYLKKDSGYGEYSLERTKAMLESRASQRRPLFGHDGRPRLVGFGVKGWEHYGLWPSFGRISDFVFFDYGEWETRRGERPNPVFRSQLAADFLHFVDEADKIRPVTACFFYADSAYIAPELLDGLAQRGIWTIIMGLDDKHRFYERNGYGTRIGQVTLVQHADLMWTTWKIGAEIILAAGGIPWYAPPAADPHFYHPIECERDLEIVFIGQAYGTRAQLVRYLQKKGFRVDAFGAGWHNGYVGFEEMVRLYSRAQVVLGVGGVQSMEGVKHLKARDFEVPMCGALYLTTYNAELADHYEIGKEILCYSSFEECAELVWWVRRHPAEAGNIRECARQRAVCEHTWECRLRQLTNLFPT